MCFGIKARLEFDSDPRRLSYRYCKHREALYEENLCDVVTSNMVLLTARESSKCFYDCIDCSTVINIAILAYVPCDLVRVIAMQGQGWETF